MFSDHHFRGNNEKFLSLIRQLLSGSLEKADPSEFQGHNPYLDELGMVSLKLSLGLGLSYLYRSVVPIPIAAIPQPNVMYARMI